MVGSECKVGDLGEFGYEFYCRIAYLAYLGGLLLGGVLFPCVDGQSE